MQSQDRLTPLDASFLHLEDGSSHMHVAAVMVFEGEAPDYDDFVEHVESRLHLVPRYRQKLAFVPLAQARPRWIDDPSFDPRFHIRNTALPQPGDEHELQVLAGRVFSRQLNRARPLWELWLVEGLSGGRFAVLSKTHHAVVDGIAGMDIISAVFAPDEEAADGPDGWRPRRPPSQIELIQEALLERSTVPAELLRSARSLVRRPQRILSRLVEPAVGVGAMAWAGLSPAPPSPYNVPVGPDRRFTWVRGSLRDFKAIKNELGGTVNDVVLTVVARSLRRHLLRRGEDVEGVELKAFVPVSVRADEKRGALGNEVAGVIAALPVSSADPVICFRTISDSMREVKDSGQALGAQALTELTGFAPPTIVAQAARLSARQRFVNLVVTNVPGPQFALHLHGRELADIFPMVPLAKNLALGVAILSYNGGINFGLVGDFDALPDLDDLAGDFSDSIAELREAAGVKPARSDGAAGARPRSSSDGKSAAKRPQRGAKAETSA
jgi:diacylglycerol O-acyltransferase / wax synthase